MSQISQQELAAIQQLIQQGAFAEAASRVKTLLKRQHDMPQLQRLLAVSLARSGDHAGADRAYRAALRAAPKSPELLVEYGQFLRGTGRSGQAERHLRKALKVAPESAAAWRALGLLLRSGGQLGEAEHCARRVTELEPSNPAGWELLAAILQRLGDVPGAIATCRRGVEFAPRAPRLHYSLGQLHREDCDFGAAADAYEQARLLGFDTPDLYRNRAEALLDGGDGDAALGCARDGVRRHPQDAVLQRTAARLHHEVDADGDPLAELHSAAQTAKSNPDLWQTLVELQKRMGRFDEAHRALAQARRSGCPDTPGILTLEAMDRALSGDNSGARQSYDALLARFPDDRSVKINAAMHGLSSGDPAWAAHLCEQALTDSPFDQLALTFLGTAWQLLGDARGPWLLDYERMVRPVPVHAPADFADREHFFRELKSVLETLHSLSSHPLEQSVRGGTQTNGFLFRLKHPLLQVLEQQIREAVFRALDGFPTDARHPFWSRRPTPGAQGGLRFAGAWSVRLRGQGYHTNHMHPQGWISSALYIALPDEVRDDSDESGYIQFGSPIEELGLDSPPRRVVRPEVGTLVLFPSYMWHGTVPFESEQPRITVAFDLLPAG